MGVGVRSRSRGAESRGRVSYNVDPQMGDYIVDPHVGNANATIWLESTKGMGRDGEARLAGSRT